MCIRDRFIAEALYRHWPKADEGALTRARAELVRESALAGIARQLDIGSQLVLGPGEMKTGGHRRDSILADAVEALVAAIYLDAGFEACRSVVLPWFTDMIAALPPPNKVGKDAKTRLQEWLQGRQPVSYTHLDVYKRQLAPRSKPCARTCWPSATVAMPPVRRSC